MDVDALFAPGGFARTYVRGLAGRLVGRAGLARQDVPDLCQDLSARVLAGLPAYDPARGTPEAFVAVLARRAAANILRDRLAARRATGWDVPAAGPDGRLDPRPDATADLRLDLAAAVAALPPRLRDTAAALVRAATAADAARDLGVSRAEVHRRAAAVRGRFEEAGIREYSGIGETLSGRTANSLNSPPRVPRRTP